MPGYTEKMAAPVRKCELLMLTGFNSYDESDMPELVRLFLEGRYEDILDSDISRLILVGESDDSASPSHVFGCFIKQNVEQLVLHDEDNELRSLQVLTVAAACLQLFVQDNWLGPPTSRCPLEFCHKSFHHRAKDIENEALDDLAVDGETVYSKSRHLIYLYIAKCLLLDCRSSFTPIQTWDWWIMRCLITQQSLLSERSPTLKETVSQLIDDVSNREPLMTAESNRDIQILFHLEVGHALHTYFEYKKAAEHFDSARKISCIQVKLTGAMGKRTRFQESDTAQLVLQVVKENNQSGDQIVVKSECLPKNLPLDDDTVLNDVKFADNSVLISPSLSPVEQVLIMGLMESYRRSRAQERLTDEEVLTYISFILTQANNWNVSVSALNLRSKLERDNRRRVERSMMQLEELVKIAVTPGESPDISCRIPLFYASNVAPVWTVQRDLATLLLSLGCTGSALDVFEKLELWDDVIACYQKLGKREKAESVIRERLAVQETPSLLCYLGDVTRGLEPYQRAWELSSHRNARSMRCMGYIYFQEEKFEQAIECFATSLKINCLQIPVWFTYGCAAMACQKFDTAVKAFRQCVSIDYDNFEAWSNLATCYVKLQQKKKAYATLQDALKCNYENWRLWENCLIIGTDCGEFEDVIRSYHRLIDLKDKWIDTEVLGILTRAVVEKIPDADGIPADRLGGKLMELFGRITSKVTSDGEIWAHYGKLSSNKIGDKQPDLDKTSQYLQKAYRCFTQKIDWEKDIDTCKKISDQAINLVQVYTQCCQGKPPQDCLRLLSSAKLMVNGALVKVKKQHTDAITGHLSPEVTDVCQLLEASLSSVVSQVEALRHS